MELGLTSQDFFFVCPGHLKDKGFCTPIIDEAAIAAKKKAEMEAEVERVKKEFEEKQKKKKEREKEKGKDADEKSIKKEKSVDVWHFPQLSRTDLTYMQQKDESISPTSEEEPRVFALNRSVVQIPKCSV